MLRCVARVDRRYIDLPHLPDIATAYLSNEVPLGIRRARARSHPIDEVSTKYNADTNEWSVCAGRAAPAV